MEIARFKVGLRSEKVWTTLSTAVEIMLELSSALGQARLRMALATT